MIAPLVSGVAGAENGHVELYRRGTSTRATWYADFEGAAPDSSGANVTLDSHGGVVVFVNELVDVIVKDSSGSTAREFVAGVAAPVVEYQGQGFSGTSYTTGATGAGSGYPVSAQTIFDRWYTSAGALDFEVLVDGTSTTLQRAMGGLGGLLFNVKDPAYGAEGDGVTDDAAAIDAALTAATSDGGVVYFPPGNYRRTTRLTLPSKVSLLGAGPDASAILIDHASNGAVLTATATYRQHIAGLRISAAQANSGAVVTVAAAGKVTIANCYVGGANCDGSLLVAAASAATELKAIDCVFEVGALNASAVQHAGAVKRATYRGCKFIVPAGTYAPVLAGLVYANGADFYDCTFDGSAATGGTFSYFIASAAAVAGAMYGCSFLSTGGGAATAITLGTYSAATVFEESGSVFGASGVTAYSYTAASGSPSISNVAKGAIVRLRTRERRRYEVTDNSATISSLPLKQYGIVVVKRSNTDAQVIELFTSGDVPPDGAHTLLVVHNAGGGAIATERIDYIAAVALLTHNTVANQQCVAFPFTTLAINASTMGVVVEQPSDVQTFLG